MEFENITEIIDFAIGKEIEAAQFYRQVSRMEGFSGTREMFAGFAKEEEKHQKMLENLKQGALDKSLAGYDFKWIVDIRRSDYAVDMEYKEAMSYNEILMLAMKREEKALRLYNAFLKEAQTQDMKTVFKVLCQEEAKHKLRLETEYDDYMAKMGD
ncbi:MAG: ferritin family protein [Desulfobacterales bacterium]|nr:ferritin family protein [Desulfobacterales bacterium]